MIYIVPSCVHIIDIGTVRFPRKKNPKRLKMCWMSLSSFSSLAHTQTIYRASKQVGKLFSLQFGHHTAPLSTSVCWQCLIFLLFPSTQTRHRISSYLVDQPFACLHHSYYQICFQNYIFTDTESQHKLSSSLPWHSSLFFVSCHNPIFFFKMVIIPPVYRVTLE